MQLQHSRPDFFLDTHHKGTSKTFSTLDQGGSRCSIADS